MGVEMDGNADFLLERADEFAGSQGLAQAGRPYRFEW
jgi:hypothetical protein